MLQDLQWDGCRKGNVSYSKIKVDISAERSKEKNNNEGNTIDLQI